MVQSRTQKTIKNSIISIAVQILVIILGFVNRKVFVQYLDIELLGYNNLFGNIFQLLNVTELGLGSIITFHLYKALADKDEDEISKLMQLYRSVYRVIGFIVFIFGFGIYFFLPFFIKGENFDWHFIHIIYLIQLCGTVSGYFLSYMRTMFTADQLEYKTVVADFIAKLSTCVLQIVIIVLFKNYILYLMIATITTIIANIIITIATYHHYKFLKKKIKIKKNDIQRWKIIPDVKNLIIQRIAGYFFGSTDNIIISMFCGIKDVALYGNYCLIQSQINNLFLYKLLNPIQASIGNYIYSEETIEQKKRLFYMLDAMCVWLASYEMAGYLLFYQPFITLWLGSEYLLAEPFVLTFSFYSYMCLSTEILCKYRNTFGEFEKDRNYAILAAIINISTSVILVQFIGMPGIQIGTILAVLPIFWGRIKLVVEGIFKESKKHYIWIHLQYLFVEIIQCVIMYLLAKYIGKGVLNIIFRIFLFFTVPTVINFIYFRNKDSFLDMMNYIKRVIKIAKDKFSIQK